MTEQNTDESSYVTRGNVGTWHDSWQRQFEHTEIRVNFNNKYKISDILLGNCVIEVQHSPSITKEEIMYRQNHYTSAEYNLLWILDGSNVDFIQEVEEYVDENTGEKKEKIVSYILHFRQKHTFWLYNNYQCVDTVLLHIDDKHIFVLDPKTVKNRMCRVKETHRYFRDTVVHDILEPDYRDKYFLSKQDYEPSCTLYVNQDPPGSGKTYNIINKALLPDAEDNGYMNYTTFLYLTKTHSAKEVVHKEFIEQMEKNTSIIEKISYEHPNKSYHYNIKWKEGDRKGDEALFIFATGDSFLYALGKPDTEVFDMFKGICKTIEYTGPNTSKSGGVSFKGRRIRLNINTLILIDEATKFEEFYMKAFSSIMMYCNADAVIVGDKLQSIEFENNVLSCLQGEKLKPLDNGESGEYTHEDIPCAKIVYHKGKTIRRFGKNLVGFLNNVVSEETYKKFDLPIPVANDTSDENEGVFEIKKTINTRYNEKERQNIAGDIVHDTINDHVDEMYLLPNDILCVFLFVSNNPFANELCSQLEEYWYNKMKNPEYRKRMLSEDNPNNGKAGEYFKMYEEKITNNGIWWLSILHKSEENKPIDTSKSIYTTRMVSVHASQGDGRDLVLVFDLSKSGLMKYTNQCNSLQYESFVNVACSRAKKKMIIYLTPVYDDIWKRMRKYMPDDMKQSVEPKLPRYSNKLHIDKFNSDIDKQKFSLDNMNELDKGIFSNIKEKIINIMSKNENLVKPPFEERPLVEYEDHIVRNGSYYIIFWLKALHMSDSGDRLNTVLRKILRLPVTKPDVNNYYNLLKEPLNSLPVLQYTDEKKQKLCNSICEKMENIKSKLRLLKKDEIHFSPDECVILHYMIEIYENTRFSKVKIDTVYNVVEDYFNNNNTNLHKHYKCLDNTAKVFNNVIKHDNFPGNRASESEPGKWLFNHNVQLARSNEPSSKPSNFEIHMTLPFVYFNQEEVLVLFLVPDLSDIRMDDICWKAIATSLLLSQPYEDSEKKEKNKQGNATRFNKDKITNICFVSMKEGNCLWLNTNDILNINEDKISLINMLRYQLENNYKNLHPSIVEYYKYYKDKNEDVDEAFKEFFEKNTLKDFGYIFNTFKKLDDKPNEEIFMNKLDEKLNNCLDQFVKSVTE